MQRWLFGGGLFIEAVSSLLAIPEVCQVGIFITGGVGMVVAILAAAYKLLTGPFGIVLGPPAESCPIYGVRQESEV